MEFAPARRSTKSVTKAQLRSIQAQFAKAGEYIEENLQKEQADKDKAKADLDDLLDIL